MSACVFKMNLPRYYHICWIRTLPPMEISPVSFPFFPHRINMRARGVDVVCAPHHLTDIQEVQLGACERVINRTARMENMG